MGNQDDQIKNITDVLLKRTENDAVEEIRSLFEQGDIDPLEFLQNIYTPALEAIGDKFGRMEIFIPELICSGNNAKAVANRVILPMIPKEKTPGSHSRGTIVIGSVKSDLHDIGKNMVAMMFDVNGFTVNDLGVDVGSRDFIDKAVECDADCICLSALLTTSMEYMREVVDLRDGFGYKDKFAVIIGGSPVTGAFAREIGADGYGKDPGSGIEAVLSLMNAKKQ